MRPGAPLFFFFMHPLRNRTPLGPRPRQAGAPLMFSQSSKALCCLNKVHLWDNKTLKDTWCWFEPNGFIMAHIPKPGSPVSCLFSITLFNFHPVSVSSPPKPPASHLSLAVRLTSLCTCHLPPCVTPLCNTLAVLQRDPGLTRDLHTWEWVSAWGQEARSFPKIYSRAWRGRWGTRAGIREMKTSKPQTLAEGSAFTRQDQNPEPGTFCWIQRVEVCV